MGKLQRTKGRNGEWELSCLLKEAGHDVVNTRNDHFDRLIDGKYKAEIKRGRMIPKYFDDKLAKNDMLFCRRDKSRWLVTLPLALFISDFFPKPPDLWDKKTPCSASFCGRV